MNFEVKSPQLKVNLKFKTIFTSKLRGNLHGCKVILTRYFDVVGITLLGVTPPDDELVRVRASFTSLLRHLIQWASDNGFSDVEISQRDCRVGSLRSFGSGAHQASMRSMHLGFVAKPERLISRFFYDFQEGLAGGFMAYIYCFSKKIDTYLIIIFAIFYFYTVNTRLKRWF